MNSIRVELTAEMFEALGLHCPAPRKALSPLQSFGPSSDDFDQKLIQAGMLDDQKRVREPFNALLPNLAMADVQLDLSWFISGEQKNISLFSQKEIDGSNIYAPTFIGASQAGPLTIKSPFTKQELDAELDLLLETGADPDLQFKVGLTGEQAIVISTLMDLQRQSNAFEEKSNPADGQAPIQKAWNSALILDAVQRADDTNDFLWVFSFPIRSLISVQDWNLVKLQNVINNLVGMRLIYQSNTSEYSVSVILMKIIDHFTDFGKLFWLSVRRAGDESKDIPATEEELIGYCSNGVNLVFSSLENGNYFLKTYSRGGFSDMIAREVFPMVRPDVQNQTVISKSNATIPSSISKAVVAENIKMAANSIYVKTPTIPVKKKKVPTRLVVGLVGLLAFACVLVILGTVLLVLS